MPAATKPTFGPNDGLDAESAGGADRWRELGRRLLSEHPPQPATTPTPAPAGEAPPPEVVIEYLDVRVLTPEPAAPALGPPRGGAWQGRP